MSFKSKNLSYMFHKEYYGQVTDDKCNARSEEAIADVNREFVATGVPLEFHKFGNHRFDLQVQYPGLVMGLGYAHENTALSGEILGDIALGFSFDYVTGVPYIPGSTIKGILRSAFPKENGSYISALVGRNVDVTALEKEIFGTSAADDSTSGDVFFDAFPSTKTPKDKDAKSFHILDLDVITPHGEGLATTPNPVSFLKVKPGVVFTFQFQLTDGILSAEEKCECFEQILKDFGVGAKTNVGYGTFDQIDEAFCISKPLSVPTNTPQHNGNFRQYRTHSGNTEPTKKICPTCGRMNYKFQKDSQIIYKNWHSQTCCSCGGKLP